MGDDMNGAAQKFTQGQDSRKSSSSLPKGDQQSQKLSPRHSPLAPLEYLQNQRRGSITDPSLHAAGSSNHNSTRQSDVSITGPMSSFHDRNNPADVRPSSPYVFGEATTHSTDYSNQQIRKLLRSPSTEVENNHESPASPPDHSQGSHETTPRVHSGFSGPSSIEGSGKPNEMNISKQNSPLSSEHPRHTSHREPQQFDYNMRRHSISVGQDTHSPYSGSPSAISHGTKRKMSSDRNAFAPVGEEIDPQLVGPGVPSALNLDEEAPAPKRRGSAIDTQRIAQLSLYDRRNSVDSRGSGGVQWWLNERRDSTSSSIFSSPSSVGYGSGFSADSPHGRPTPGIAAFAWPANSHPPEQQVSSTQMQSDGDASMSGPPRPYDPNVNQLAMMPPITFAPDRRMSVPENMAPTLTGGGQSRVLRPRSRPPSSQLRSSDATVPPQSGSPSSGNTAQEDSSTPSPNASTKQANRELLPTPYSRSPELRVSHKLAERKRRKEMKDLFDELRDQLPADRGMKASKWEILSKAIDFISQLKQAQQDMLRDIDLLRHELENVRQGGIPPFGPGGPPHPVVYSQGPVVSAQYAPGSAPPHTHPPRQPSQDAFPPGGGPASAQTQNGAMNRAETLPT